MFKRVRRFNRIFALKLLALYVVMFCFSLLCGCGYCNSETIEKYNDFLLNYEKYSNKSDTITDIVMDDIVGFEPIIKKRFDFGRVLNGKVFVKIGESKSILNSDGSLVEIEDDLSDIEIIDDKYVFEANGKKGVKDIFGNEIISSKYDKISIKGSSVLAIKNNCIESFADSKLIGKIDDAESAVFLSETCILADGVICSLNFEPLKAGGYYYIDVPYEGIVKVKTDGKYVGYVRLIDNKLIDGNFIQAQNYSNGTAVVMLESGKIAVIDTDGKILYKAYDDRVIESKYANYYCYVKNNMFGVMNERFEDIVLPLFPIIKEHKVFGEYIIVPYENGERLFSVENNRYVMKKYDKIEYADGLFFAKSTDTVCIFDSDLNLLYECEKYEYKQGILGVCKNGKYVYYKRLQIK